MKILHITDAASGGVLTSLTALARSQSTDPEVGLVAMRYTPREDSPNSDQIAAELGPHVDLECWSNSERGAVATLVRGIFRELHEDWDIIHLHSSRTGFLGRMLSLVVPSSAHLVYSPHGFSFNQAKYPPAQKRVFRMLERIALIGGRDLVLVSPSEADLAAAKLPGCSTAVLANAVDSELYSPRDASSHSDDSLTPLSVIHVGRIVSQKRPDLFAEVARLAEVRCPGRFTFSWIGEGDRSLLSSCPEITVTGWLPKAEIREHLTRAGLMLFTSAGEGMPMAILEASSTGVPTIGCDVIGVRDLIDHGVDGMLFRTADEAVTALVALTDDDRRRAMAIAARERVRLNHRESDLAAKSRRIYCRFMNPNHPATTDSNTGSRTS